MPKGKLKASGTAKIVNPKPLKPSTITGPKTKAKVRQTISKAKKGMY